MKSPEFDQGTEVLKASVVSKAQELLGEPLEPPSAYLHGRGVLNTVVRAIGGRTYVRRGSLVIGLGFEQVGIYEETTVRLGKTRLAAFRIYGDMMADSEGRKIEGLWEYDLHGDQDYSRAEFQTLEKLLSSEEGQERDDLFDTLVKVNRAGPYGRG
jgi:hypothetical protein